MLSLSSCSPLLPPPSVSLAKISTNGAHRSSCFSKKRNNLWRSRVTMSVCVGSRVSAVDDELFKDYSPTCAFLFPGQGINLKFFMDLGVHKLWKWGQKAQSIPAAAELFQKANNVLGFDLLDVCTSGPKEKLDSPVRSQVTSPVQWELTVKTLLNKGLKKSYELGPGKVIAGIVKRMNKTADLENISA